MPELPEVETLRRSLADRLIGRKIVALRTGSFSGVLGGADPAAVSSMLAGSTILDVTRRGKYLSIEVNAGGTLLVHLRMTGNLVLVQAGHEPLRFEHLAISLDDGTELRFADQRKFGRVIYLPEGADDYLSARLGVEPLSNRFSVDYLQKQLEKRSTAIKNVLLDQRAIAGIGNIYADEALFRARIHPLLPGNELAHREVIALRRSIRWVLRSAIERRGTSFSTFLDGYGEPGANQRFLQVYGLGRKGAACPRCGGPLSVLVIGGRSSHVCERCQRRPGPSVDPVRIDDAR